MSGLTSGRPEGKDVHLKRKHIHIMETQNYIALAGKEISISVSVFLFKEENAYIAYCPSLDLSGYDATEDSAKQDFEYVLREWLREQMDNGTLYRDLAKHGWKVGQEKAIEPSVADMIRGNKSAGKIFSLPEFKKTNIHTGILC